MEDDRKAHALNVPGPYYVVDGCCTSCGVPDANAPELFAFDANGHCFVRRQPESPDEIERALRVIWGQELGCIRYAGDDLVIRRRLAEADVGEQCDVPPPRAARPVLRNHVTFDATTSATARTILENLRQYLLGTDKYRFTTVVQAGNRAQFSFSWTEDNFHKVMVRRIAEPASWLLQHRGNMAVSNIVCDWLAANQEGYRSPRWFTEQEFRGRSKGRMRPW